MNCCGGGLYVLKKENVYVLNVVLWLLFDGDVDVVYGVV